MSRENVELIESAFAAWNRGDINGFADHAAEDVAWVEIAGRPEGPATERIGRERMREALGSLFDAFETYHLEIEQMREVDGRVLVVVCEVGRGRASGIEVDSQWGYLITVENGEFTRIEAYRDAAAALDVAGVTPSNDGL
jgi:ketosteroid isomerase-like protein